VHPVLLLRRTSAPPGGIAGVCEIRGSIGHHTVFLGLNRRPGSVVAPAEPGYVASRQGPSFS